MYLPNSPEWTTELTDQHLSSYKVQTVSSSSSLTPVYPESPHKGLIRLTFGGHHCGTKIAEGETGSTPHCSAAATGVPQTSRAWSGTQQSYSRGARLLEGKLSNRNTSSSTIWVPTQRPNRKVSNYSDDRWINLQRWEETNTKRRKTTETRIFHLLQKNKTPHQQGNKAAKRMSVMKWQNQTSKGG